MQSRSLFETGMVPARVAVLLAVFDPSGSGSTAGAVIKLSGVRKTMVSEAFAALEHDGFLIRHTPERDKRGTVAYLTSPGRKAAEAMLQAARELSTQISCAAPPTRGRTPTRVRRA